MAYNHESKLSCGWKLKITYKRALPEFSSSACIFLGMNYGKSKPRTAKRFIFAMLFGSALVRNVGYSSVFYLFLLALFI